MYRYYVTRVSRASEGLRYVNEKRTAYFCNGASKRIILEEEFYYLENILWISEFYYVENLIPECYYVGNLQKLYYIENLP